MSSRETTSEGSFVQLAIPRFNGHYDHWNMLMVNFFRSKEYLTLIETGYEESTTGIVLTEEQQKRPEELKLKDLKVKNYLFQSIDRIILETILKNDTAKKIWDLMKKKFEGGARVKHSVLQALRRDFETLKIKGMLPISLTHLQISDCRDLKQVDYRGLCHLSSLKKLHLWDCPLLQCLPEEGLPKSISTLRIQNCQLLEQRCQKPEGEDWPKIAHIQHVHIF